MKAIIKLFLFLLLVFPILLLSHPLNFIETRIEYAGNEKLILSFTFHEPQVIKEGEFQKYLFPLEGTTYSPGKPELPAITRLVAIPEHHSCTYRILREVSYSVDNVEIIPFYRGTDYEVGTFTMDSLFYRTDVWYPETRVEIGKPSIMRDVRFVPLTVYPVTYNPLKNRVQVCTEIEIELEYHPSHQNPKTSIRSSFSKAFDHLYRTYFLNYENIRKGRDEERGTYLIIVPDALYNNILPFADWKNKKGNPTIVKKTSEVGFVNTQIRNYILNAYSSWPIPPDYVLLIGDIDAMPAFYEVDPLHGTYASDLQYSLLEGTDFFPDIFLGRISVDNTFELDVVVAKILGYERTPDTATNWLEKMLCVSGDDFTSQVETKIWVQEYVENFGITVDTLFARNNANATMISNAINNGRGFINYRGGGWGYGWREPHYDTNNILFDLNNGWKLPVVTSVNCGSGKFNYSSGECFGEIWIRAGTPTAPRGGVAFLGATHWTYASRNNPLDVGIYREIFTNAPVTLGQAMNAGKLLMYLYYPDSDTTRIEYGVFHILGDPELNLWTDVPQNMVVTHPSTIPCGNTGVEISVKDAYNSPIQNALVCLVKGSEVYSYKYSDANGMCHLQISPTTAGVLDITVTAHNFIPYESQAVVVSNTLYVGYFGSTIDDDNSGGSSGNGDGNINPGETIEMEVVVKNFGTQTALNVDAILRSLNPSVTVTDSTETFGNIAAGDTVRSAEDYDFVVSPDLNDGDSLDLALLVSTTDSTWYSSISLPVKACTLTYQDYEFFDGGNGQPEPGESGELVVTLKNNGSAMAYTTTGVLISGDPSVSINDSIGSFGSIGPGNIGTNSSDRFDISILSSTYPGKKIPFSLLLTASGYYSDTIDFSITLYPQSDSNPTGPDEYGYFAYDTNDTLYTEVPVYSWVEIDPTYGGSGTLLPLGEDGTTTISLPFSLQYYGITYNSISICSNGWLTAGSTNLGTYTNWPIPETYGPPRIIAPFWDDLSDSLPFPNHVYYHYDSPNHRFFIEWSRIYHTYADSIPHPADPETFEAILLDPNHYPTLTGDAEFIFQYHTILNPLSSTVGIENETEDIGLQYLYNGIYSQGGSAIDDGMAIKITTDPPVAGIEEKRENLCEKTTLTVCPTLFTESVEIRLSIPEVSKNRNFSTSLSIYDVSGRCIKNFLLSNFQFPIVIDWDGSDQFGSPVQSGIYFIRFESLSTRTEKIIKIDTQ
jgi:hypothetical protein